MTNYGSLLIRINEQQVADIRRRIALARSRRERRRNRRAARTVKHPPGV
ncbi:MAG: hypothetical protein ACOC2Y_03755 [Spirochaetota bacterium]